MMYLPCLCPVRQVRLRSEVYSIADVWEVYACGVEIYGEFASCVSHSICLIFTLALR
jgi:hypothetical protein